MTTGNGFMVNSCSTFASRRLILPVVLVFVALSVHAAHARPASQEDAQSTIEWREALLPSSFKRLTAISMLSPRDGWSGGRDGLLLRWDGRSWHRSPSPVHGDVVALQFLTGRDGWLAAYDIGVQKSSLHHYDGTAWRRIELPAGIRITAMVARGKQDVWLFGRGGRILHYDGTWHESETPGYRTPRAAVAGPDGTIWVACDFGTVWRWDGKAWENLPTPISSHLYSIAVLDTHEVWAVGDGGAILRLRDGIWDQIPSFTTEPLHDVQICLGTQAWICGTNTLLRWDGAQITSGSRRVHGELRAVHLFPNGAGWVVGYGSVLQSVPSTETGTKRRTLGFYHQELLPNVLGVQGVAFGDANGDGAEDIYIVTLRDANHLLVNDGHGRFIDRTGESGLMGMVATSPWLRQVAQYGAVWGDTDNDGIPDLFVAGWYGGMRLHRMSPGLVSSNATHLLPVDEGPLSANSGSFSDVDVDGDLDLFVTNEHGTNQLWINNGRGEWSNGTERWGLRSSGGSRQAAFGDIDGDGDPDLYICNWHKKNSIYRNDGDRFTDITKTCTASGNAARSNGVTLADLDNDGDLDIVVTRSDSRNSIWRNDGEWNFSDVTGIVGFASGPISFGSAAADFDNDGDLDLVIVNNQGTTYLQNVGGIEFLPSIVGGLADVIEARAVAVADIDNDGDQDMFIGSRADLVTGAPDLRRRRSACFINRLDSRSSISVRAEGVMSNRSAIGAKVFLYREAGTESADMLAGMREINAGGGFLSQNSTVAHFGVPDTAVSYTALVRFPGGREVRATGLRAGERITISEVTGVAKLIHHGMTRAWYFVWSPRVQRYIWPLMLLVPLMVFGIRHTSQKLLWPPVWTVVYTITLSLAYPTLGWATSWASSIYATLIPSLTIATMLGITVWVSHLAGPRTIDRLAYRRQVNALASRANMAENLSTATNVPEIATAALTELERLFHVSEPRLCVLTREGKVDKIIPSESWHIPPEMDFSPFTDNTEGGSHLLWDVELPGITSPDGECELVVIVLATRDVTVALMCGFIESRHVSEVVQMESAIIGFASLVAMSLHNARLQEKATKGDADYRMWLDQQATRSVIHRGTPSPSVMHRELVRHLAQNSSDTELLVGESDVMKELVRNLKQVAAAETSVLIMGESGTGKELAARTIHQHSKRKSGPFVAVNCGAIPEGLLESELFGHTKGAFTGANNARIGVFQRAEDGTIFLDEIAEMDPSAQVRLLRVLQERVVTPVGGESQVEVNTRVVAATLRDLASEVAAERFREDLFYRLNVFPVLMPPLKEHIEDLPILVATLMRRIGKRTETPVVSVSEDALARMVSYHWPGNVRELENTLERALLLSGGEPLRAEQIQFDVQRTQPQRQENGQTDSGRTLGEVERDAIITALRETNNNVSEAARKLDITRDRLRYRIRKYNIET
jgi:DNA-binding NtrC family response regulator